MDTDSARARNTPRPLHQPDPAALGRIVFVLMNTSHPGNVGAAARAMKTMGLSDLRLVAPRFPDVCEREEAIAFSSNAHDVLQNARHFGSLTEAIADVSLAVAVSADPREFGPAPSTPEESAASAFDVLEASGEHRVAFVFGAERTGLSIASVQACGLLTSIPGSPVYASLNLAQAIQILAYVLRREAIVRSTSRSPDQSASVSASPGDEPAVLAGHQAVEGFLDHFERALLAIGFLDPAHPKKLMPRLRRLFLRARLSPEEVDLLRGISKLMERKPPG